MNNDVNGKNPKKRDRKIYNKKDELRIDHKAYMKKQKQEIKKNKDKDSSCHIEDDDSKEGSDELLNEFSEEYSSNTIDHNKNKDKENKQKEKSIDNSTIVIIDKKNINLTEETKLDMEEEKLLIDEKVEGMKEEETEDDVNKQYVKYPSEDSYDGEQGEAIETNVSKKQEEKEAKKILEVKEHLAKVERRLKTNKKNQLMNSDVVNFNAHKKDIKRLIPDTHIELHLWKRQFKRDFIFMKNWHAFHNNYILIRWSDLAIIFLQVQAEHHPNSHFARAHLLSILSRGSASPIHLIVLNAIIKELTMFRLSEPIDNAFYEIEKGFKVMYTDDELPTDAELREKRIKKKKQNQTIKIKERERIKKRRIKEIKRNFYNKLKKLDI